MSVKYNSFNLQFLETKYYDLVLTKLYSLINLQKIRYEIINNKLQIEEIKKSKYYITPHFVGQNFLFFMCTIENNEFNILISKKELKFYKDQNKINELKIYKINAATDDSMYYTGTIMDGKLIDKNTFIINELYYLSNINVQNINLKEKLVKVNNFIDMFQINQQNLTFKICRLYEYNELADLVFNKIKSTNLKINGIIFLPELTSNYYIYTNDTEFDKIKSNNLNISDINTNSNTNSNTSSNSSLNNFYMKKTNIPDVYELYLPETTAKHSIAHIPDIKTSHYFKKMFQDKNMIQIQCIYSTKFKKYIPVLDDYINYYDVIL